MTNVLADFRGMIAAGTADYTVNGQTYWTDDQLQVILDHYRTEVVDEQLYCAPDMANGGGSATFNRYYSAYGNFETTTGGTAVFIIRDNYYNVAGTATYTPDYRLGRVTFAANTLGIAYYLTGMSYNLNRAAAEVWRTKAAHFTGSYDISTDNHNLKRSQLMAQAAQMASFYAQQDGPRVISVERGDC
jgi:hypothetical protein